MENSQSESSGNFENNSAAFADAIARARQIAAKIHAGNSSNGDSSGVKRQLEEENPDFNKKLATNNDAYGAQLSSLPRPGAPVGGGGTNAVVVDEWKVPEHMVGLIIGRGGEQINRIQAESGCKVQMATTTDGTSERTCTLTGSQQAVDKCKELMNDLISGGENRGQRRPTAPYGSAPKTGNEISMELMIPAGKAGLVIGKGGETIRNLQSQAGVKMVIIQDQSGNNNIDKPLKITGDPQQCEYAKQLVLDLLAEREMDQRNRGFAGGRQNFNARGRGAGRAENSIEQTLNVPANQCGRIIGKGGDYIRYISQTSGAHIELSRGPQPNPNEKTFILRGSPQQIEHAQHLINEKINDSQYVQGTGQQQQQQQQPQQHWGDVTYQQQPQQAWQASMDPSKQASVATDPNAAAWAAYYAQYYNQQQQYVQQQQQQVAASMNPSMAAGMQNYQAIPSATPQQQQTPAPQPATSTPASSAPSTVPSSGSGGQPDYSAAWVQYYRSMGMHKEADAIQNQMRNQQAQGNTSGPASSHQGYNPTSQAQPQQQPQQSAPTSNGPVPAPNWGGTYPVPANPYGNYGSYNSSQATTPSQ